MASLLAAIWVLERRKDSASWGQGGESMNHGISWRHR